ncbi:MULTISPECIES: DUF924 family protein [unclassified Novosphingobium]|uniref:DUF924 family protein n=1 Tax=unclassified Novosphingobium TaxID=2644732 RepID=UPI00146F17B4|nr:MULTISPECIES: DUF924 family protein [unclassified Novosphingobium]NMN03055.1 uncharacterized protein (DUF924 family) [Novosphingobium sp. SG919]NMN86957.1 uncharacterized protein (DUF924 family) [Novosphingobium sp. SG916]
MTPRLWAQDLLHFWFVGLSPQARFASDPAIDALIVRRFAPLVRAMATQPLASLARDRDTLRAAVLLFDQVPRNAWRGSARAFAYDARAVALTRLALRRGWDRGLDREARQFLLMPLMHSERRADQRESVARFTALGDSRIRSFALAHARMVLRFGRFPHRNAVLGRSSTPAEQRAVAAGNHW